MTSPSATSNNCVGYTLITVSGAMVGGRFAWNSAFITLASDKTPRGLTGPLRENAVIQSQVAQGEAALDQFRAQLERLSPNLPKATNRPSTGQNSAVLVAASADLLGPDRAVITDGEQYRNAALEPSRRLTRRDRRE